MLCKAHGRHIHLWLFVRRCCDKTFLSSKRKIRLFSIICVRIRVSIHGCLENSVHLGDYNIWHGPIHMQFLR
jgi:hypothetical protein